MTQQKEDDMEKEILEHSCPHCHCDFTDKPLEVIYKKETKVFYMHHYKKGWEGYSKDIINDKLFDITCGNCNKSIYSFFEDEFTI